MEKMDWGALLQFSRDCAKDGDYRDAEGFVCCGVCGTRKQCEIDVLGQTRRLPIMCQCQSEALAQQKEQEKRRKIEEKIRRMRAAGLTDERYAAWTFAADDGQDPRMSAIARRYVEEWGAMYAQNIGLLLYGGVGTGKSFFACCIANALLDQGISALVTNVPGLLNQLQSMNWDKNKNVFLRSLQAYELLVVDDLGAERETPYALEQLYAVIDARYRSGRPLIVTTNLTPDEMRDPGKIALERVYDRIKENAVGIRLDGPSRRKNIAKSKRSIAAEILSMNNEQ